MEYPTLTKKNIFAIPTGDLWDIAPERVYMIYAPLNGHISLATPQSVEELERCAAGEQTDTAQQQMLETFQAKGTVPVHYIPQTPHDLYQVDLLINYTCNFKCIYCYSAAGRSTKHVDFAQIKTVVDYLFCSEKKQANPYIINFSGGGEPLINFDLIRQTVEYIEEVTKDTHYKYNIGLVTNGSLITPEIVDYLHQKKVDMAVSFEILERLQNKERGSYDKVAANIDLMLDKGYPFGIRTTFTPESVTSMCEMIEELERRFPRLKKVVFDVVLSPDLFATPDELKSYYDNFLREYYRAKELGKQKGIAVESIAVETLSMVRDRTCEGKIVLTPVGSISSCARVSSPQESLYNDYVFGDAQGKQLKLDEEQFAAIMAENNIYSQPICHACFARWNCGGGCRLFHQSFSQPFVEVKCDFTRKALRRQAFGVLSDNFRKAKGTDLHTFIAEKIDNGTL